MASLLLTPRIRACSLTRRNAAVLGSRTNLDVGGRCVRFCRPTVYRTRSVDVSDEPGQSTVAMVTEYQSQ